MNKYLANAFSLNMLPPQGGTVRVAPLTVEEARALLAGGFVSAVGHADTAAILTGLLGLTVEANRINVLLSPGDLLIVAQYRGPRLPEGTTTLPEGASFQFFSVTIE